MMSNSKSNRSVDGASVATCAASSMVSLGLANFLFSHLLEMSFIEVSPGAEDEFFGSAPFALLEFNGGKLYFANIVRNLLQAEIAWCAVAVDDSLCSKCVFKCVMQNFGDGTLAVVIVDLDCFVSLKWCNVVEKEKNQILAHLREEGVVIVEVAFLVRENGVVERTFYCKRIETREQTNSLVTTHLFVAVVSSHQRVHVQGNIWKPSLAQGVSVARNALCDVFGLVVEDKGQKIILGFVAAAAGFINKDGKLFHKGAPSRNKNAGGIPRPVTAPLRKAAVIYIPRNDLCRQRFRGKYAERYMANRRKAA